ncbi:hypothetical protein VTI74DRAFT_6761 [Chaetomium olivicolor]
MHGAEQVPVQPLPLFHIWDNYVPRGEKRKHVMLLSPSTKLEKRLRNRYFGKFGVIHETKERKKKNEKMKRGKTGRYELAEAAPHFSRSTICWLDAQQSAEVQENGHCPGRQHLVCRRTRKKGRCHRICMEENLNMQIFDGSDLQGCVDSC